MAFTRITAAEAAALVKNGDNIALSGFTPAGTAKAVTAEIQVLQQDRAATEFFLTKMPFATVLLTQQMLLSASMSMQERLPTTIFT